MADRAALLTEALDLSAEERVLLALELLDTTNFESDGASDDEIADAWAVELQRRVTAMDEGVPGVPWDQVQERLFGGQR